MKDISVNYQTFYFFSLFISLFFLFEAHTISLWRYTFHFVVVLASWVALICTFVCFCSSLPKYNKKNRIIILFLTPLIILDGFLTSGYSLKLQLWLSYFLIIGAKRIDFRTIVKFHLIIEILFCITNLLFYSIDWIDKSYVFIGDERESVFGDTILRSSYGYPAATDFATHLLYILLDFWIIRDGILVFREKLFYLMVAVFVLYYCDARQPVVCMLIIFLFSFYISNLKDRRNKLNKTFSLILIYSIPFLFIVTISMSFFYDGDNIIWIGLNYLLSGRLWLSNEAIKEYGIHLLGQKVTMVGGGFSNLFDEYNYVDSGFLQFLLHWGILLISLIMFSFVKIGNDAYKRDDYVLLFSLLIAGLSTVITQFLFFINYSIFLFAITANHNSQSYKTAKIKRQS